MKRCSTLILLAVLVSLACMGPAAAVLPKPDGNVTLPLSQGWYDNQLVWFICTTTNDIKTAQAQNLTLAGKLYSAIPAVAQPLYVVVNFQQGPVFSVVPPKVPASNAYTGLWQIYYIRWTTGIPRPIINDTVGDPKGIPIAGVTVTPTNIVVDYPILIVGQLSIAGPTYKIPQLVSFNAQSKTAVLPYFNAFNQDFITKAVSVVKTIITESSNKYIAPIIGANYAPGLGAMSAADSQNAWLLDPTTQISPPSQLPVLEQCASVLSWRNANQAYSPIVKGHLLVRLTASPSSIFNNPTTIQQLLTSGALSQTGTTTLNVQEINSLPK